MAEGTSTFEGLSLPRLGEYEQVQQALATDMATLTGAASMTGDFLVCQDSDGTEVFAVSSSGKITSAVGVTYTLSSTTVTQAVNVTVTSTGAFAAGAKNAAYMVTGSTKSALNACYGYNAGAEGIPPTSFCLTSGSASPTYFISVGSTPGTGAAADCGFFDSEHKLLDAPSSATVFGVIKILAGSKAYHLLALPDTASVAQ